MCGPEEGSNQPEDVVKEAIDMENREGFGNRRHRPKPNSTLKVVVSFMAGIVLAIILPELMSLGKSGASAATTTTHNKTEIDSLKGRVFSLEQDILLTVSYKEQAEASEKIGSRITRVEIADAAIAQELKDIRLILADMQTTLRDIDRRTR